MSDTIMAPVKMAATSFLREPRSSANSNTGPRKSSSATSLEAQAVVDELLGQADDAFRMPFYDLYTKQRQHVSKLLIVISGSFTQNAIEKICEKLEKGAVRNNVIFIDGEKIRALIVRLRGVA
jgi:hypothetical protein